MSSKSASSSSDVVAASGHRLFPASRRVYVTGSRPDLRVPMREITLSATRLPNGTEVPNEPVRVYDTSGPWGDPDFAGDVTRGARRRRRSRGARGEAD
jgi:phosphomethylpyrimidine synthase